MILLWKLCAGEHNFLDVIDSTKKGEVRVIVELNFRGEFEMARGSEDYNRLVRRLPEVFVGKVERLSNLIKILCMGPHQISINGKENDQQDGGLYQNQGQISSKSGYID